MSARAEAPLVDFATEGVGLPCERTWVEVSDSVSVEVPSRT